MQPFVTDLNRKKNMSDYPYAEQANPVLGGSYAMEKTIGVPMRRTKMERLKDAKAGLEAKLAEVNNAIKLLEENPKMNEIIEALERAGV